MESKARRVFKKASTSDAVTVYLGRRDFYDHGGAVDPIDGVVAVNPGLVGTKLVFARFSAVFNYSMGEANALGVGMRKVLFSETIQVYPPPPEAPRLTKLQKKLFAKIGGNAFAFTFQLPPGVPSSVTLQSLQAAGANSRNRCGVDHEVLVFAADGSSTKVQKKDSVRLNVRKLAYVIPDIAAPLPTVDVEKSFLLGSGHVAMHAALNKETYYHGEPVEISVVIDNQSSRNVKALVLKVRQFVQFRTEPGVTNEAFNNKSIIAQLDTSVGFPVNSGSRQEFKFSLVPSRQDNLKQLHLALDGQLKDEDTCLASSTLLDGSLDDAIGMIVSYDVKITAIVPFASDVICKLPFLLSAPPPPRPAASPTRSQPPTPMSAQPSAAPIAAAASGRRTSGREAEAPARPRLSNYEEGGDDEDDLELEFVEFVQKRVDKMFSLEQGEEAEEFDPDTSA
eukprot:m.31737 g.31737  ORF g.31737 m.31737 type:complete len:451 (+) comp4911_c0_seq2:172-1524(+)